MEEFKINEYLTLKLEGVCENNKINRWKTMIYVAGELFRQCSQLVLNIPIMEISTFDEIQSIDEAIERLEINMDEIDHEIPSETEFWGHCSNLQVWYENDYDTRILHSNLAFPLLKELSDVGDIIAKRVFKEEIAKRLATGYPSVVKYLIEERYIKYLTREELLFGILEPEEAEVITKLDAICEENLSLTDQFVEYLDLSLIVREKHVIGLTLSFQNLKTFPEEITQLILVNELRLGGNKFSTVPESIKNLKNLHSLYIFRNKLIKLPESIGELNSLQHLSLKNNYLKHLPESIGNLSNLRELDLSDNQIINIPEFILRLNSLKILNLKGNSLSGSAKNRKIIKKVKENNIK